MSSTSSQDSQSSQQIYEKMQRLQTAINKISRIDENMCGIRDRAAQKNETNSWTGYHCSEYIYSYSYNLSGEYEKYILDMYAALNKLKSEYDQLVF